MKDFLVLLNRILTPAQRKRLVLLQGYYLVSAFLQVVGVASVAPFIAVVGNPSLIHGNDVGQSLYDAGGFTSDREFLIAFAWALMAVIVVGNAVLAGGTWLTIWFARQLGVELQRDVLRGYLHRDFERVSRTNSARLVATFTQGIARFVFMVVQPLLYVNASVFVAVLVLTGLVWFSPGVAVSAATIIAAGYWALYAVSKGLLRTHGEASWSAAKTRYRFLSESLGALKEIKLFGSEQEYEERVDQISRSVIHSETMVGLLSEIPRYALEALAFCALLGLGISLLAQNESPSSVVTLLSVYAMAGYRLLPAAQTIFKSAAQIRANVDIMHELLPEIVEGRGIDITKQDRSSYLEFPDAAIRFENVTYRYPETAAPAVDGLSCTIPSRGVTAIVGQSGAGKSTLADLLLGLLSPQNGTISVHGVDIASDLSSWRRGMGYVPQSIFLVDDTLRQNIVFDHRGQPDESRLSRAVQYANMSAFVDALPAGLDFVVGERGALLSGGQRQRVGIARALYHEARVLVMDEATSALDSVTEREIMETLSELGREKPVVMIAHRLSTIRGADHIIMVEAGRVVAEGTFAALQANDVRFRTLISAVKAEAQQTAPEEVAQT